MLLMFVPAFLSAQFSTQLTPTYADYAAWNPAAIAPSGLFNGSVNYFSDSFSSESQTTMLNAAFHYPIKFQKFAAGGHLTRNDFSGLKQTKLGLGFKYNVNITEFSSLSLGIGSGIFFTRLNDDNFIANSPEDPLLTAPRNSNLDINLNGGFIYRHTFRSGFASELQEQKLIVSISSHEVLPSVTTLYNEGFTIDRGLYVHTLIGYSHPLIPDIGTTFYYTNSISTVYGQNHTALVNFNFNNTIDFDLGFNTSGKLLIGTGFAFSNLQQDDRLRVKLNWSYDTRSITTGNQIGWNLSMFYTYDYDYTSFEF